MAFLFVFFVENGYFYSLILTRRRILSMKRISTIISLFSLFFFSTLQVQAQQPFEPMEEGAWMVNAGIGLGKIDGVSGFNLPAGFAFRASIQKGMWEVGPGTVSLGGEAGMVFNSTSVLDYTVRFTRFNMAPRSSYHYGWHVEGLDTYAGMALGLGFLTQTDVDTKTYFYGSVYLGCSYFFNNNLGINVEVGYGTTFTQVGVVYRF
jgi:hypothetical protein